MVGERCYPSRFKEGVPMEKAIVVVLYALEAHHKRHKKSNERSESLEELNQHLAEGWRVKHSFAMGGTASHFASSLVILDRDQ